MSEGLNWWEDPQEQDEEQAEAEAEASWITQLFSAIPVLPSWPELPHSNNDGSFPTAGDTEHQKVLRSRTSMALTVASSEDESERFGDEDDNNDGVEVSWTRRQDLQRRLRRLRRRLDSVPYVSKRLFLCIGVSVLLIVMVSVVAGTLSSRPTASAAPAAVNVQDTGEDIDISNTDDKDISSADVSDSDNPLTDMNGYLDLTSLDFDKPFGAFSTLHPVDDLGMVDVEHARAPPVSVVRSSASQALPTNAWYQNLIVADGEPNNDNKAYAIPYVVDAIGPIPGLRVQPNHLTAESTVVQLIAVDVHGLTLGAASAEGSETPTKGFSVESSNPLGLTMQWDAHPMTSSVIRGMPYATMHYPKPLTSTMLPTLASEVLLQNPPLADDTTELDCDSSAPMRIESELKLTFINDFTWMVFVSEPVLLKCTERDNGVTLFQVQQVEGAMDRLTIRAALLTNCTNGLNAIYCTDDVLPTDEYEDLLRERANLYPGPNADIQYALDTDLGVVRLDWDVQDMKGSGQDTADLIMYALPHHLSRMNSDQMPWSERFCTSSLVGSTCVVSGSVWELVEDLPIIDFRAPRPPRPQALSVLSEALQKDIEFRIPENFRRGAGDTYFSGKVLARLGRILLITEELQQLCSGQVEGYSLTSDQQQAYEEACGDITLPTDEQISDALDRLRSAVEVWINGSAEAKFVYDSAWGGIINCGCVWDDGTQGCTNYTLPNCPALEIQGLNFGSAYYNDHHFHYGYHVYAAAALTHFDKEWGRDHFEEVLLLVRDFANPSSDDVHFPRFRHKDWYYGSSWASGITMPTFSNGMNQESSSEAIAAYEAVALFGKEMVMAWNEVNDSSKAAIATNMQDAGSIMAATEIRSTDHYWHVRQNDESRKIYPPEYEQSVVGILWNNMAQFTTWFGNDPFLIYGIQLLPLTPISENRDDVDWVKEMYEPLAASCSASEGCLVQGWSVLQLAMLASIGHVEEAMEAAQQVPSSAFDSPGGNGHSMTNTLWYMATRPDVDAVEVDTTMIVAAPPQETTEQNVFDLLDCGVPESCTSDVLNAVAEGYTCRERILWLMKVHGIEEVTACRQVALDEYPDTCGPCA